MDQQKALPAGQLIIPIILGGHNSLTTKLTDYIGVRTENYNIDLSKRTLGPLGASPLYYEVFDDVTANARVTHKQLDLKALIQ